jgi:hypothetical protein
VSVDAAGHVLVTMTLDGKTVSAMVNTIGHRTYMGFNVANKLFGLTGQSEGVRTADKEVTGIDPSEAIYPFHALVADGLTVSNPKIYLYGDHTDPICDGKTRVVKWPYADMTTSCNGGSDIQLGTNLLSALRLYFAFGENTVYFTPS